MNTSEVLDLSKENIQPLKHGRNAAKLGTALQAQTNSELQQKLLAEREEFELLIRMYDGEDPLKPHYDYVKWIEQSFPKHGPESNIVQILENTLTTFKDDERYKQDLRYAELLIKYIDTQPNPLEIYQLVYNQGLCTMCAPFYKAWADELDKINDMKSADQVYELGKKVKAQPLDVLEEGHLRFQLSVGRRMLGRQEEAAEAEEDCNRQALYKLQKKNIHGVRDPVGAPGRIKQSLSNHNNNQNAPFKVYQGEDNENNMYSDSQGKMFPKQKLVNKENTLKPGPWTQNKGKVRTQIQVPTSSTSAFRVHEDEEVNGGSRIPKTPSVPGALKTRRKDMFTCPLAIFEPPDPTKIPMYCKNKVYAGGREFQFEELRAALYNRRHEQLMALKLQECPQQEIKQSPKEEVNISPQENKKTSSDTIPLEAEGLNGVKDLETVAPPLPDNKYLQTPDRSSHEDVKPVPNTVLIQEDKQPIAVQTQSDAHVKEEPLFENKLPLESNTSLFHSQSFTVNTKEAMTVVQEMWNSPSPSPAFGRNLRASAYPSSPAEVDESGVFKVPPIPPPLSRTEGVTTPMPSAKLTPKSTPSFPIFFDDEQIPETPQPFQIYSDNIEQDKVQSKNKNDEPSDNKNTDDSNRDQNFGFQAQLFSNIQPPATHYKGDAATLKMLAFQSESEDSGDEQRISNKSARENINNPLPLTRKFERNTSTEPVMENRRKFLGLSHLPPACHEEDKFEDMTCNTKAFDFVLPSSTPLVGHLKNTNAHLDKNCANGSYISEEMKKCGMKQDLSLIFEASKERYSSSSGSSGCKTQASVCTVASTSTQPAQAEAGQISMNNELERSIGLLNISGEVDPFSTELITQLLSHIGYPKNHHLTGLHRMDTDAPVIHTNSTIKLGPTKYSVIGELGKGSYARVLKATKDGQPVALKQQRPSWEWEWFIVRELQNRLPPNMMNFFLLMNSGYIYKNASILESEWAQHGTILSVVNRLKIAGKGNDLYLAMLFSSQMITIIEYLHKCKIIHGDVKPDNFVLFELPKADVSIPCLKLIDFGRSIDMTQFPESTKFTKVVTTDGFQCNEMKEGRPWTYQTDMYGLAGSIYCVLFYDYMKVIKKGDCWQLSQKIPRYMKPAMWEEIFKVLLNIESCEVLPDLTAIRETLEKHFRSVDLTNSQQSLNKLSNILLKK